MNQPANDKPKPLSKKDFGKVQIIVEKLYSSAIAPEYFEKVKKIRQRMQEAENHKACPFRPSEVKWLAEAYKIVTKRGPVTQEELTHMLQVLGPAKMHIVEDEDRIFIESLELTASLAIPGLEDENAEITQEQAQRVRDIFDRYKSLFHTSEVM